MTTSLDVIIPVSQVSFSDSIVSENKSLRRLHPEDYTQMKIIIYDMTGIFSPTAKALDNSIKTATFNQSFLDNFINDPINSYSVSFNATGSFDTDYNKFYNGGTLVKSGTDFLFVPREILFNLPSFVTFSGNGYGTDGSTLNNTLNFGTLLTDLNGKLITDLAFSISNFYNYSSINASKWYSNLNDTLENVLAAGSAPKTFYTAFSNFLVASKEYDSDLYNWRFLNFSSAVSPTGGHAYVTDAILKNGTISLDLFPNGLIPAIPNDPLAKPIDPSVEILSGFVADSINLSPIFQTSSNLFITPSYSTEIYFNVHLKPGFSSYPAALINSISNDPINSVKTLLSDPSVLINLTVEYATAQDLNADGIMDGENFVFGISDIKDVNGIITITPDKPTNFFVRTGFDDFHSGSAMPDLIYALRGNDNISVFSDNDSVYGGAGNDIIDGGVGYDRAYFQGPKSQYIITTAHGITTVADSQTSRDDIDTLVNVEELVFTDQTEVTVAPSTTLSFRADIASNAGQSYRLYQAALDRTPDLQGLSSWINYMDHGGQLNSMSQMFIESPEFKSKYGPLDNYNFVNQLYLNVLDRSGEATGVTAWVGALDSGSWTRAQVLVGFSESAENQANVIGQIKNGVPFVAWWLT